jgi:hypothetical protein
VTARGFHSGSVTWIPHRGDYGVHYSAELIELIEDRNCHFGCLRSGTDADREEFGPGGRCTVLAFVGIGDVSTPIPELDPRPDGPFCRAREPVPTDFELATRDMEPLFGQDPS